MTSPNYELSDNQKQFTEDAEEQGFEVDYGYSGRGMYGKCCPSVRVRRDDPRFVSRSNYYEDQLGLGTVCYARN